MTVKMIDPPKQQGDYPDRLLDCEEALEPLFHDLMKTAYAHGWEPAETRKALFRLLSADRRKDEENAITEAYLGLIRAMNRAARS